MRIHPTFNVQNSKGKECNVKALFYYASGEHLKDFNNKFSSVVGNVMAYDKFTPNYPNTSFEDFQLFMPYSELHMDKGNYTLKFHIILDCEFGILAQSKDYTFDLLLQ